MNRHLTQGFLGDAKSPKPGVFKGDEVPFGQGRGLKPRPRSRACHAREAKCGMRVYCRIKAFDGGEGGKNRRRGQMKCPECQSENREGVKFCEECGSKMEIVCPNCGNKIPIGKKFCGECGQKLEEFKETKETKEVPEIDYEKPDSYTPKFMAEKILTTRSSVEGERKLVTVLFADVASFTTISEKLDPEEVHEIMDGCFKILMEEIHKGSITGLLMEQCDVRVKKSWRDEKSAGHLL